MNPFAHPKSNTVVNGILLMMEDASLNTVRLRHPSIVFVSTYTDGEHHLRKYFSSNTVDKLVVKSGVLGIKSQPPLISSEFIMSRFCYYIVN
jgi:hypothetical protein